MPAFFLPADAMRHQPFRASDKCHCGAIYSQHGPAGECPFQSESSASWKQLRAEVDSLRSALRDDFAMAALQGIATSEFLIRVVTEQQKLDKLPACDTIARLAYTLADSMLKERQS
jgi:TPR repeat protein